MRDYPSIEPHEEMECPECEREIPIRVDICPHCELALH